VDCGSYKSSLKQSLIILYGINTITNYLESTEKRSYFLYWYYKYYNVVYQFTTRNLERTVNFKHKSPVNKIIAVRNYMDVF
jgi:hypothetical protein